MTVHNLSPFGEKLLKLLRENGGLARFAICDILGAPRTTVYDNLLYLLRCGLVQRNRLFPKKRKKGRPIIMWCPVDKIPQTKLFDIDAMMVIK